MNISKQIIDLMNQNEKFKRLNTIFNETAAKEGITGKELEGARQTFLMMLMSTDKEIMSIMAKEVYEELNTN